MKKHTWTRQGANRLGPFEALMFFSGAFFIGFLVNCASPGISNQAEVKAIKTVAIVSLSSNEIIYNAAGGPLPEEEYAARKKKADEMNDYTGETTDTTPDTVRKILGNTSAAYNSGLAKITHWTVVPIEEVVAMPAYQEFPGETVSEPYATPSIVYPDSKYFNPFRDPKLYQAENQRTFQALVDLAGKLDVDAVAVVRTELGYQPEGMQMGGGLGNYLAAQKTGALPTVGIKLQVVTRTGKSAIYTITERKYQGAEVEVLRAGLVNVTGAEDATIKSYGQAVQKAIDDVAKQVNEELKDS